MYVYTYTYIRCPIWSTQEYFKRVRNIGFGKIQYLDINSCQVKIWIIAR